MRFSVRNGAMISSCAVLPHSTCLWVLHSIRPKAGDTSCSTCLDKLNTNVRHVNGVLGAAIAAVIAGNV
jgi:hypothetical protein